MVEGDDSEDLLMFDDFQDFEIQFNTEPEKKHFVSKELIQFYV